MNTKLVSMVIGLILIAWVMYWLLYALPKKIAKLENSDDINDAQQAARLGLIVKMAKSHPGIYVLFVCVVGYLIWLLVRMFM